MCNDAIRLILNNQIKISKGRVILYSVVLAN